MSYELYKIFHLTGVMALFLGLGGVLALQGNGNAPSRKLVAIFHGVGLLLILVAGFGLIAKMHVGFPLWVLLKIGVWFLMAGMLVLGKRRIVSPAVVWVIAILLGIAAAYLAVRKPGHTVPDAAAVSVVEDTRWPKWNTSEPNCSSSATTGINPFP